MTEFESKQREYLTKLQSILDESIASGVPGLSAAIHGSTSQWHLVAGCSDVDAKTPINQTTTFGIGSITKVFVAVVILQLVEEQKISLNDRASSILDPKDLDGVQNAADASIQQLLSHTGGIISWEDDSEWQQDGRGRRVRPGKIWRKDETLDYVRRPEDNGLTVGKFSYANTNYTILGLIIERITQNTAEGEVRRRILQPVNMEDTYFEGFEQPAVDKTPHRYHWATETFRKHPGISSHFREVRDDLIDVTGTNLSVSWTAGGMVSTPSDLLKFATALQNGTLLRRESVKTLTEWKGSIANMVMGNGIFRLDKKNLPGTWIGHNGGVLGFTAALWWNTDGSCAVSILSNVGASHAGTVPSSAAYVATSTNFLNVAAELAVLG